MGDCPGRPDQATTTARPADDIVFRGVWDVHPTVVTHTRNLPTGDDVLEIHGSAAQATAVLEVGGVALTGQVDGDGDLLLSAEIVEDGGCATEIMLQLVGPLELSDETTTGEASVIRRCGGVQQCQTLFTTSYDPRPGS